MTVNLPVCYALIPARSGSKGIPDKNITDLHGKPLIAYTIEAAKKSQYIHDIFVSTDSQYYADIAIEYGASVPFLRPPEIATDHSSDLDFIKHFVQTIQLEKPFFIIHLRPTTPIRNPKIIDQAISVFIKNNTYTALRSIHEMPESAYKQFELSDNQLQSIFTNENSIDALNQARQLFPKTYAANGYIDIIKSDFVLESNQLHGNHVFGFITPFSIEIDSYDELKYIEYIMKRA